MTETRYPFDYYNNQKRKLLRENGARLRMFQAMDDMAHNRLEMPPELTRIEGFHQVTPTEPGDALRTAARILSTVAPKITYQPLDSNLMTRERANQVEKVLGWHYTRAGVRAVGKSITKDALTSAARYDEVTAWVDYIPWQRKLAKQTGKDEPGWEGGGRFAIHIYNPKEVHVKRSDYGVTAVFLYKQMTPDDVIELWGDKAEAIIKKNTDDDPDKWPEFINYNDWMDKKDRLVWLSFESKQSDEDADGQKDNILMAEPHKLPFIPWACVSGGSSIDTEPEYQRDPLLSSVYQSGSWQTQAIMESIMATEVIKTAAAPLYEEETMDGKPIQPDYTVMGGVLSHRQGESVTALQKPQLDPRLRELADRTRDRIGSSTLPAALGNPTFSAGTAFASINAQLRAASNALDPMRTLTETWLSNVYKLMLKWLIFTNDELYAYDESNPKSSTFGDEIRIDPATIAPNDIYIAVKLTANLPLDRLSEINAVSLIMKTFGVSKERALEMLDITNAAELIEEGTQEALTDAEIQNALKVIGARGDAEAQRIVGAVQMELQQQQMAAQQQQQAPPPPEAAPQVSPGPGLLNPAQMEQMSMAQAAANVSPDQAAQMMAGMTSNLQGAGFNPAMGGTPPGMGGSPTREQVTMRDRGGNPVAGG